MCVLGSPFSVPVRELVDPSKVRCFGPGLGVAVRAHVPQNFTVDSSKAGVAPLVVQLFGPTGTSGGHAAKTTCGRATDIVGLKLRGQQMLC